MPEILPTLEPEAPSEVVLTPASIEDERQISRFLYDEAEFVDNMEWEDWIDCLHDDIYYWAPVRENRVARERREEFYPKGTSVYFEESKDFLKQRVFRLRTNMAWAEEPPSRSRHMVTNIRVDARSDGDFSVRSNFLIYRSRGERYQDTIAGERRDIICRDDSAPHGFLIKEREIRFDMSTILVKNLSLFY